MADKPENTPAEELGQPVVESELPSSAEDYFEKNKRKLILLICLVVLASAAYIILKNVSKEKDREAANAFTAAETAEQYRQVSIDYQGTVAGGNALLMKADQESKEQNPTGAVATLTEFVSSYKNHPRYAQGLFALAEHSQSEGNVDETKRRFQEIVDTQPKSEIAPLALMRLGDIAMAAKNYDEARSIYNSVMPRFPANPFIQKVTQKVALLDLESPPPDLKKPDPPKIETTTAPTATPTPEPKPEPVAKSAPKPRPATTPSPDAKPKAEKKKSTDAPADTKPKAKAKKKTDSKPKAAPDSTAPETGDKAPPPAPAGN
jgi:predicted negative regulator of RcsB-dependent stress response